MRSDTAPAGGARLVTTLSAVSAVLVAAGGILVVVSTATHLIGRRPGGHATSLGVALGMAGLAVGVVTLVLFVFTRAARFSGSARRRPAGHPRHAAAPAPPGRERGRVLKPADVYSPGGLIDVPRDARVPGATGTAGPPGFSDRPGTARPQGTREAFRVPMTGGASRGGPNEARPSAGRMGSTPPRPGYQAGVHPGSGWGPPGRAGRPAQQPMPSPGRTRAGDPFYPRDTYPHREAGAARDAYPSREGPPLRDGPPPREAPPPRSGASPRHQNPARDAGSPRDPRRPDAPVPPFEPVHPSRTAAPGPFGQGAASGTGRPSPGAGYGPPGTPGYGPAAGRRPEPPRAWRQAAPGAPGGPGPADRGGAFSGGYAQVIRPQPNPGQPADPARPADQEVYVYRDVSDRAPTSSARQPPADDAAYWYDLLAEDSAPRREEARGPFEPLLSSGASAGQQPPAEQAQPPPDAARDKSQEAPAHARARQLEQLRDLYLTAEAIGEQNVDKHFDQILAQQRELISEYFRQSAAAEPDLAGPRDGRAAHADAAHRDPGGPATPPEGVSVRAQPPRAW